MKQKASKAFNLFAWLLSAMLLLFQFETMAQSPVASFSVSTNQGCQPLNVVFTNTSTAAVSSSWNFGNGNTSTQTNPSNVFTNPGTFTVTLTVIGSNGNSNSTTRQILVVAAPVSNFSFAQTTACQGGSPIQFQNLSLNSDSCVWDFGDGTSSSVNNPAHVYAIAGTFSVSLIAFNKLYGCSNVKTQSSIITIYPKPSVIVTVNDSASCDLNHIFQFTSQAVNGISWEWNFGDATTSTLINPTHVYQDTGYFNVSLIVVNSQGCSDTSRYNRLVHLRFNPVPVINVFDSSGCAPFNTSFITTAFQGASFAWSFGDSTLGSGNAQYHHYYTPGNYTVNLTAIYQNGCTSSASFSPVEVYPSPALSYTMTNYTGCLPLTVNFINNTPGSFNWLWDFGDGTTSSLFAPTHTYTTVGSFQVSLTASNSYGCSQGYPLNARVITYDPVASFAPDVTAGCPPLTVNFNDYSQGATLWQWNFGDGTSSTSQFPTHIYSTAGLYTVTLIIGNASGCKDTLVYPTQINVNQPVINFVPPAPLTACAPHSVHFADNSGAVAWLWDFGDGTTSTVSNPSHTYETTGTFVVSLTTWGANSGCANYIANFQTFIIDGTEPHFTYTVSPCPPYVVTFLDSSLNASGWTWSFGDGGSSTLQNPTHIFPNIGSYDITLTATSPGGCNTTLVASGGVQITGLGANATVLTTDTVPPFNVQFHANSSNATWWLWDFGDGSSSTLEDPTHVYTTTGPFTITLTIGNDSCQYQYNYPPVTFGSSTGTGGSLGGGGVVTPVIEYHCAPYNVSFYNPFPDAVAWLWDFGDGITSSQSDPEHAYRDSGAFNAVLIAWDSLGVPDTMELTETYYIVQPITDFNITTTNTCSGVIVDVSTSGIANTFSWNFGNGQFFSTPTVSYTYPNVNASYVISLTTVDTNQCGAFVAKSFAVNTVAPISSNKRKICAGDTVFFDTGNMNFSSYAWTFGDGGVSTMKNPYYVYQDSGYFSVSLSVIDINGCAMVFPLAYRIEVYDPLAAFNYAVTATNCSTITVQCSNQSLQSSSWLWNFGDGTTSNLLNPVHYYTGAGFYNLTLTAFSNICSSTITIPSAIYNSRLIADFTYSQPSSCVPVPVTFQDLSVDAVKWHWDFGDGDTSNIQNPIHIYTRSPITPITLVVTDINGCNKSISKPNVIVTVADFSFNTINNCNPVSVAFSDSSQNAVSWEWNFGDGGTSLLQNPNHIYSNNGIYSVQLIVQAASGCHDTLNRDSLVVVSSAEAHFSADNLSGCVPLQVAFTDSSINANQWLWDFGDGGVSNLQFPSHIYTQPGVYTVTLIVFNQFGCSDTMVMPAYISVRGSIPFFSMSASRGCAPLLVEFTDNSIGAIGWDWHFGDGTTDTLINPVHVYMNPGNYTVSLYTLDSTGCSTIYTSPVVVQVDSVPLLVLSTTDTIGCTPFTVNLNDAGTFADSVTWLMGDGTVLYGSQSSYTYSLPGVYSIRMVGSNLGGCTDTLTFPIPIIVNAQPLAGFTSDIQSGCSPATVQFTDTSQNLLNATYLWDFGNGDTSSLQHPTYLYQIPGDYTITLTITNSGGCTSVVTMPDYISMYDPAPPPVTELYRVTVNSGTVAEVNWHFCFQNDMDYYLVSRYNPITSVYDSIAAVPQNTSGMNNTTPTYVDSSVNTLANSYSYKIQAVDFCGSRPSLSVSKEHTTINLQTIAGLRKVDLTWSPYLGCSFTNYEIYRGDQINPNFQLIAIVDTITLQFTDTSSWCPEKYIYKIKAIAICNDGNFDSWSNESEAIPESDIDQQQVEVVRSTVVDNSYVLTEWKNPVLLPYLVDRFTVYRSTDNISYSLLASVPSAVHEFSDMSTDVQNQEYYYKVEIQNVCNSSTNPGNISSSILLNKIESEFGNQIKWTRYIDWDTGVEKYVIEKQNSAGNWEEVKTVSGNVNSWEEE